MSAEQDNEDPPQLSHLDSKGRARMVDVADKKPTDREAIARGRVDVSAEVLARLAAGELPKGNIEHTARLAGIMAAKKTSELIPLCHGLSIDHVDVQIERDENGFEISARARSVGKTGVEMEALTAVSITALTLYDMLKAIDKSMIIGEIRLIEKRGGKSGTYERKD